MSLKTGFDSSRARFEFLLTVLAKERRWPPKPALVCRTAWLAYAFS